MQMYFTDNISRFEFLIPLLQRSSLLLLDDVAVKNSTTF